MSSRRTEGMSRMSSSRRSGSGRRRSHSTGRERAEESQRHHHKHKRGSRSSLSPNRLRMAEESHRKSSRKLQRSSRSSSRRMTSSRGLSARNIGDVSPGSLGIANAPTTGRSSESVEENVFTKSIPAPPLTTPDGSPKRDDDSTPAAYTYRSASTRSVDSGDMESPHNPYEETAGADKEPVSDKETLAASDLHKALASCSWKEFFDRLVELQESTPDRIVSILSIPDGEHQSTVLHTAVWKAPPALTKFLLDLITPLDNVDGLFLATDADGNTPIHLCCANLPISKSGVSDTGVMKHLAEAAPQTLQLQNTQGDTPLHLLVSSPACCVSPKEEEAATVSEEAVSILLDISEELAMIQDTSGATPLHVAIINGANERVLVRILEAAPSVANITDERGMLPLHYAAAFGQTPLNLVDLLLMANPNAITEATVNGDTPLHLLASNASTYMEYLSTQRMAEDTEKMFDLLMGTARDDDDDEESEVEREKPLLMANAEKMNPLHCCALFNAPAQVTRLFMKNPSGPKAAIKMNDFGATPLHVACAQPAVAESVSQVASLATAAAAAIKDCHKRTPLHVAAQNSHATGELIKVLTNLYPDAMMERTQRGHLPLHLAAQSQASESVVKALIAANPKAAESRNKSSNTPLHDAAKYRASAQVVQVLLETYADAVYIQNQYGNLPLHCATAYQAPSEVVQLLLEAWPDGAAMQNRNQDAPLHYAAAYTTSVEAVKPLIDAAPAAVLLLNSSGQSPLDRAKANNAPSDIIALLEESAEEWTKKASKDGWGAFSGKFET